MAMTSDETVAKDQTNTQRCSQWRAQCHLSKWQLSSQKWEGGKLFYRVNVWWNAPHPLQDSSNGSRVEGGFTAGGSVCYRANKSATWHRMSSDRLRACFNQQAKGHTDSMWGGDIILKKREYNEHEWDMRRRQERHTSSLKPSPEDELSEDSPTRHEYGSYIFLELIFVAMLTCCHAHS